MTVLSKGLAKMILGIWFLQLLHFSSQLPRLSIQWYEFSCIGGDNAFTGLWLSYTSNSTDETGTDDQTYSCRAWVNYNFPVPELQYYEGAGPRNITSVSLFKLLLFSG